MTKSDLVSVIVPTYNRRSIIGETIESILHQTHTSLELIIVDDGSTDGTKDYVQERFGSDERLRYLTQSNRERARARNHGVAEARGQYVAFIDSDDLWTPEKLERQLALMQSTGADCCYSLYDVLGPEGRIIDADCILPQGDIFTALLVQCFVGSMTPLVRRACFHRVGGFCEDRRLLCFEDWEMWTRLATKYHWTVVPEILGTHRLHEHNSQHAASYHVDELRLRLCSNYDLNDAQREALHRYAAARRWHWATAIYKSSPSEALVLLARLVKQAPAHIGKRSFWGLLYGIALASAHAQEPS